MNNKTTNDRSSVHSSIAKNEQSIEKPAPQSLIVFPAKTQEVSPDLRLNKKIVANSIHIWSKLEKVDNS